MANKSRGLGANPDHNEGRNKNETGNIERTKRGHEQGQNQNINNSQSDSQPGLGRSRGMGQSNAGKMGNSNKR